MNPLLRSFGFLDDDRPSAHCPTCCHPYYRADIGKACDVCGDTIVGRDDEDTTEEE